MLPGIPLGSLTAQIASKSFWTKDMLNEALKQINKTVLSESSKILGSDNEKEEKQAIIHHAYKEDVNSEDRDREWRTPSSSVDGYRIEGTGYRTPAYLSPGITRKLVLTEDMELPFLASQS
jgi:methionyl-tRNA formyltransferase